MSSSAIETAGSDATTTPRVAIVTPSYNQARFLQQAIDSVLEQSYPAIDYLVVDGGSTDGSLELLRGYGDRLRWISEPDQGQADAIAKGFTRTRGEILTWINSDDALLPGAVETAVAAFRAHPAASLVYSNGPWIDEQGRELGLFPWIEPFDLWRLVYFSDYILQPSAFFRRSTYEAVGGLDPGLHFAMDWDLWIKLAGAAEVIYLEHERLGCSRIWHDTKTSMGGWRRIAELARLARRHTGRSLTPAVKRYALDTFGSNLRRTLPRPLYRFAGWIGAMVDGAILRRMSAHGDGWLGPRAELVVPQRWKRARFELEVVRLPRFRAMKIELRVAGGQRRTERVSRPGTLRFEVDLPPAPTGALCRIEIRANHSFRGARDHRRLALRLLRCEPASPDGT